MSDQQTNPNNILWWIVMVLSFSSCFAEYADFRDGIVKDQKIEQLEKDVRSLQVKASAMTYDIVRLRSRSSSDGIAPSYSGAVVYKLILEDATIDLDLGGE